jgi:ketosteroid isomerase-like protein
MHLLALIMLIGQTSLADSVKQTFREYERRLNTGDYAGLAQYYADDPHPE